MSKNILSSPYQAELARAAAAGCVVAVEFDGILTGADAEYETAHIQPTTRRLFDRLCRLLPCVVLSERSFSDTLSRLDGLPIYRLIANHGIEPGTPRDMARWAAWTNRIHIPLATRLLAIGGVRVENKRYSLSIFHETSADAAPTLPRILSVLQSLPESYALTRGPSVVHVLPHDAPNLPLEVQRVRRLAGTGALIEVRREVWPVTTNGAGAVGQVAVQCANRRVLYGLQQQEHVDVLFHALIVACLRANENRRGGGVSVPSR